MCVMAFIRAEPELVSSERHDEDAAKENEEASLRPCGPSPELIRLVSLWCFATSRVMILWRFHSAVSQCKMETDQTLRVPLLEKGILGCFTPW